MSTLHLTPSSVQPAGDCEAIDGHPDTWPDWVDAEVWEPGPADYEPETADREWAAEAYDDCAGGAGPAFVRLSRGKALLRAARTDPDPHGRRVLVRLALEAFGVDWPDHAAGCREWLRVPADD